MGPAAFAVALTVGVLAEARVTVNVFYSEASDGASGDEGFGRDVLLSFVGPLVAADAEFVGVPYSSLGDLIASEAYEAGDVVVTGIRGNIETLSLIHI